MKKFVSIITLLIVILSTQMLEAKLLTRRELAKSKKQHIKLVKAKSLKQARKDAKYFKKYEGWQVFPGERPLSKMLEDCTIKKNVMKFDYNTNEEKNGYIWATANGLARNKSAAQMQAIELAKVELDSLLMTATAEYVDVIISEAQLTNVSENEILEITAQAKIVAKATLSNVKPIVLMYRTAIPKKGLKKYPKEEREARQIRPGNVEVQVSLFYDLYQLDIQVRNTIKKLLKDKLKDDEVELRKLMNL